MKNTHLPVIEITNRNIPEKIRARIEKVQNRIIEVENIIFWLKEYPGNKDEVDKVAWELLKIIADARAGLGFIITKFSDFKQEDERAILSIIEDYSRRLWDISLIVELNEQQ